MDLISRVRKATMSLYTNPFTLTGLCGLNGIASPIGFGANVLAGLSGDLTRYILHSSSESKKKPNSDKKLIEQLVPDSILNGVINTLSEKHQSQCHLLSENVSSSGNVKLYNGFILPLEFTTERGEVVPIIYKHSLKSGSKENAKVVAQMCDDGLDIITPIIEPLINVDEHKPWLVNALDGFFGTFYEFAGTYNLEQLLNLGQDPTVNIPENTDLKDLYHRVNINHKSKKDTMCNQFSNNLFEKRVNGSSLEQVFNINDELKNKPVKITEEQVNTIFQNMRSLYSRVDLVHKYRADIDEDKTHHKFVEDLLRKEDESLGLLYSEAYQREFQDTSHLRTIIHGDLHQGNIFMQDDNQIKLIDFDNMEIASPYRDFSWFAILSDLESNPELYEQSKQKFLDFHRTEIGNISEEQIALIDFENSLRLLNKYYNGTINEEIQEQYIESMKDCSTYLFVKTTEALTRYIELTGNIKLENAFYDYKDRKFGELEGRISGLLEQKITPSIAYAHKTNSEGRKENISTVMKNINAHTELFDRTEDYLSRMKTMVPGIAVSYISSLLIPIIENSDSINDFTNQISMLPEQTKAIITGCGLGLAGVYGVLRKLY